MAIMGFCFAEITTMSLTIMMAMTMIDTPFLGRKGTGIDLKVCDVLEGFWH